MEILESNFEEEMIASMNEPRLKKPKLDDGVIEEAFTMETLGSNFEEEMKPKLDDWVNDDVETMDSTSELDYYSELDYDSELEEEMGKDLFGQLISEVCDLALAHRQGESYEFEGVEELSLWSTSNISNQYQLEFCAKDLNAVGYPRKHFKAYFSCGFKDTKGNCEVRKFVLLGIDELLCMDLEKLNLVDSDDNEEPAVEYESLYSTGFLYDSDFETTEENIGKELGFPLVELCTSALGYYHKNHKGVRYTLESYGLERGLEGFRASTSCYANYKLEFFAKSMTAEGKPIRTKFNAGVMYLDWDKPEEFVVKKCLLVEDGEAVPDLLMECVPETPPEYIQEKESAKFDEFCIYCLDFYKNNSGGCYEFVQRLTTSRRIFQGVQYVFVFHAKQPGNSKPVKFVASCYNKRRIIEPYRCEPSEDQDSVLD